MTRSFATRKRERKKKRERVIEPPKGGFYIHSPLGEWGSKSANSPTPQGLRPVGGWQGAIIRTWPAPKHTRPKNHRIFPHRLHSNLKNLQCWENNRRRVACDREVRQARTHVHAGAGEASSETIDQALNLLCKFTFTQQAEWGGEVNQDSGSKLPVCRRNRRLLRGDGPLTMLTVR